MPLERGVTLRDDDGDDDIQAPVGRWARVWMISADNKCDTDRSERNVRVSAVRPHSIALVAALLLALTGCGGSGSGSSPLNPTSVSLAGRWVGTPANGIGPSCMGDCSSVVLTLDGHGGGQIVTRDGKQFAVTETVDSLTGRSLRVVLTGDVFPGCASVGFHIESVEGSNVVTSFSGSLFGRCCNTLAGTY